MKSGFDRLARPYRWLEYLTFGRSLERCRLRYLPQLTSAENVLVLGDGDGRFAARFLSASPRAHVHAIDGSPAMLLALEKRCSATGAAQRLSTQVAQLPDEWDPTLACWDLVATHFFLDCLSQQQVELLVSTIVPHASPEMKWVISEFEIPAGLMRLPAQAIVAALYSAFRMLAGLQVQRLPDYATVLKTRGFKQVHRVSSLGGFLVSELWVFSGKSSQGRPSLESSEA